MSPAAKEVFDKLGENSFCYFKMTIATLKSYLETIGMSYLSAIKLVTIIKECYGHVVVYSLKSWYLTVGMSDTF